MSSTAFHDAGHGPRLSAALKTVRRQRGLKAAEVAGAMGMPLRSYEYFESGEGRFDFAKVQQFTEVTNSDAFAILGAVFLASPAFAARAANNKIASVLLLALEAFNLDLGDDIALIDTAAALAEFNAAFARLAVEARRRRSLTDGSTATTSGPPGSTEGEDRGGG